MIAGRYSLDREIGRGGTGVVWLARDEMLGRQVAVKRIGLLPGADRTDLARAEREARLSARLNHPHVVAIFDVVVDSESDARWLVMEYVDGITLSQLVRDRGRLSPDEAAPIIGQVADALAAAHAAGIAHRDVKPSNILLTADRQVKLTDFGIARIATDPSLTQTGMVTGSPAYLAPEVATGGRGDQAADVWGLGATLFHLLAGRPPYEMGDNVLGGLYRMVHEEPPRLDDAGWMTPLLESAMVRDPEQRWTMAEVRDFLVRRPAYTPPTRVAPVPVADRDSTTEIRPLVTAPASASASAAGVPPATGRPSGRPSGRSPGGSRGGSSGRGPGRGLVAVLVAAVLVVLALGIWLAYPSGDEGSEAGSGSTPSASPTPSPSASPSEDAGPTAAGMEAFIRDYVATTAESPTRSWQMLSPKFQTESGGFEKYQAFWGPATGGRVLSISADPETLVVSYQVRFEDFDNGPGPTVLQLRYDDGTYRIDGESSAGFVPSG